MKPETLIRDLMELLKSFHFSNGNVHEDCDACIAIRRATRYLNSLSDSSAFSDDVKPL